MKLTAHALIFLKAYKTLIKLKICFKHITKFHMEIHFQAMQLTTLLIITDKL